MCKVTTTKSATTATTKNSSSSSTSLLMIQHHHKNNGKEESLFGLSKQQVKYIEYGLLSMAIVYGSVLYMDPKIFNIQADGSKYCNSNDDGTDTTSNDECYRMDLVAYKIVSFLSMSCMGIFGTYQWYNSVELQQMSHRKSNNNNSNNDKTTTTSSRSTSSSAALPETRLFSYLKISEIQNVMIFCYQIWDIVVSLQIPEHREMIFMVHHVLAACVAYWSLKYQLFGYYSIYYGGCSEFSSIFLVISDIDSMFPTVVRSYPTFDTIILICKGLFVGTFTYFRVIGWIQYSIPLWKDVFHVTTHNLDIQYRESSSKNQQRWLLYMFLILNVLLGCLQVYWLYEIVQLIRNM